MRRRGEPAGLEEPDGVGVRLGGQFGRVEDVGEGRDEPASDSLLARLRNDGQVPELDRMLVPYDDDSGDDLALFRPADQLRAARRGGTDLGDTVDQGDGLGIVPGEVDELHREETQIERVSDPELRVSDEDRDRVAAEIREHFAQGRIDRAELDERLHATFVAKTQGQLDVLTADLSDLDVAVVGATPSLPFGGRS